MSNKWKKTVDTRKHVQRNTSRNLNMCMNYNVFFVSSRFIYSPSPSSSIPILFEQKLIFFNFNIFMEYCKYYGKMSVCIFWLLLPFLCRLAPQRSKRMAVLLSIITRRISSFRIHVKLTGNTFRICAFFFHPKSQGKLSPLVVILYIPTGLSIFWIKNKKKTRGKSSMCFAMLLFRFFSSLHRLLLFALLYEYIRCRCWPARYVKIH